MTGNGEIFKIDRKTKIVSDRELSPSGRKPGRDAVMTETDAVKNPDYPQAGTIPVIRSPASPATRPAPGIATIRITTADLHAVETGVIPKLPGVHARGRSIETRAAT